MCCIHNFVNITFLKNERKIEEMRLSVIVPMYNAEKWISRCIESIIGQSFNDFEVIIVDDGSTDNSLNIVKSYCLIERRIRCISIKNQGSAGAKNVAFKYVSGDIVTFVDADDFIEAEMYKTMIFVLDSFDADIVECSCRKINKYGRELCKIELLNENIEGNEQCTVHFIEQKNTKNYMCNKIYKKKLFKEACFPYLYFSEDYYMNAILHSKANKKVVMSEVFYNYMIYPGQSTDNRCLDAKRIDGIKAGNLVANFFGDKKLKTYASLYACKYALSIADIMYGFDYKIVKDMIKQMKPEIIKALSHISFDMLNNKDEKKIVYQCILMLIANIHFYDFRWMFE